VNEKIALAALNCVQVMFLAYLTYRQRVMSRDVDGHLKQHMEENGG